MMKGANTRILFPNAHSLHDVIHSHANADPTAMFLIWCDDDGEHSLAYPESVRLIERLAFWFDRNFEGKRIAVVGENSVQWILCYYALVCSRNTAALPDPNLSAADLAEILNRIGTSAVLLSPSYPHAEQLKVLLPNAKFFPLTLDAVKTAAENAGGANDDPSIHADNDPGAIHFTSGTTGLPKCVLLTQGNLLANSQGTDSMCFYDGTPRVMPLLPYFHTFGRIALDYGMMERKEFGICKNVKLAAREMILLKPDIILGVSAMIPMLLAMPDLSFLKRMILGGAAPSLELMRQLREKGVIPVNAYGLTETAPVVAGNLPWIQKDASVGVPPANGIWEIRISEKGEVCVRGRTVMAGYIGDETATKEAIDPNGWFHTGDLGYIDEDGFLFLTGRSKNLICLSNGKNVSPEALENKLSVLPGVREVIVYASEERICAEIYAECEEKALRKAITGVNRELPTYERIQKLI